MRHEIYMFAMQTIFTFKNLILKEKISCIIVLFLPSVLSELEHFELNRRMCIFRIKANFRC